MFNAETICTKFLPLIGWHKSSNPSATYNPMGDLLTASSGQYYNSAHPLLTIDELQSVADLFSTYTYSAYSAGTTYDKGAIVTSGGNFYASEVSGNIGNAVNLTAYWRQTNPFNEWLRIRTRQGIIEAINDLINLKFKRKTAANLLKRSQVINPPGTKSASVGDTKRYVAWSVVPCPLVDVIVKIDRIAIQMSDSESTTVELYKNGASTPETSTVIAGDGTSDVIWKEVNWELERGNFYYIAVDRNDIDAIPINALAGMSNYGAFGRFPGTLPYVEVGAFEHDGPGESGWNDVNDILTNQNNYGLNLHLSARCDYTDFFCDQAGIILNVILKRVAINMMRELAFNTSARINREQLNVPREAITLETDGHPLGRDTGLMKQYRDALESVTFDHKSLSKDCLPCQEYKLRIGSV